jgi:hypothetical protein
MDDREEIRGGPVHPFNGGNFAREEMTIALKIVPVFSPLFPSISP